MKKMKLLKAIAFMFTVSMCVGALGQTAHAAGKNIYEAEPNDTMDTAQEIEPNVTTAATSSEGKAILNIVYGHISEGDHDWYKVYFKSGDQYVTLDASKSASYGAVLYKENGELVDSWTFTKTHAGVTGFDFKVTSGYYYVEIIGKTSYSGEYILTAGDPHYTIGSKKVTLQSITMSGNKDTIYKIDWSNENIPKDAMVNSIRVSDVYVTKVSNINFRNEKSSQDILLYKYPWYRDKLCKLEIPVKSKWTLTFKYIDSATFTPAVTVSYMYKIGREGSIKQ